ncbi:DnaA N-terminal domain-containing protein [Paracerasibacillus soli]|uniref:DnaA N-terminal domain-containing protein n=1 Tax=Paracerasibacillus soli TaxID=480284 RepID=A0ABU5CPH4_9BACI|nr:DnaA N-terminal domain-containing protein [Virgibacillus soli]MDY0407380.1 DnaA N-terminal domain-containing protein [Virgibacillus soli]
MDKDEAQLFWEIVIQMIQQRLSKPMHDTWIAPLTGQIVEDNTIVINAASKFAREWIVERYAASFYYSTKRVDGSRF